MSKPTTPKAQRKGGVPRCRVVICDMRRLPFPDPNAEEAQIAIKSLEWFLAKTPVERASAIGRAYLLRPSKTRF
jgi:hypothetical protein